MDDLIELTILLRRCALCHWGLRERRQNPEGGSVLNPAPGDTDSCSASLQNECKQTILRQINSVESSDDIQRGGFVQKQNTHTHKEKKKIMSLLVMWLISSNMEPPRLLLKQLVIRILAFGWRGAKSTPRLSDDLGEICSDQQMLRLICV